MSTASQGSEENCNAWKSCCENFGIHKTKSMKKRGSYLLILAALLGSVSCLDRQFIKGRAELISTSDTILLDSSIFAGYVYPVDFIGKYPYEAVPFEIWIENTKLITTTDSTGYYYLKTMPGTYTVKCQVRSNEYELLIEEKRNIKIEKNQKIRIDFYIGTTVE